MSIKNLKEISSILEENKNENLNQMIKKAKDLGKKAYHKKLSAVPSHNDELMNMVFKDNDLDHKDRIKVMKVYSKSWNDTFDKNYKY